MSSDRRFDALAHVVEIANTSVDVNERLEAILGAVISHLEAGRALLFLQEQSKLQLVRAISWPRGVGNQVPQAVELGQGRLGEVARRREPLIIPLSPLPGDPVLDPLAPEGELAAVFPVMDDNRLYAVLVLVFGPGRSLESEDVRLLQMIAREMAGSLRNYRLYMEAKKRIAELNVISDLGRAAVSTIEVDQLLDIVAGICAKLLGARGGLVSISEVNGQRMRLQAHHGKVPAVCLRGEECTGRCRVIEAERDSQRARVCRPHEESALAEEGLCVTLSFKGRYRGQLCVFDKVVLEKGSTPGFNADDRNLLNTMSSMVSAALENALTFQRVEDLAQHNEEMVGALATLYEISTVLMTTVDFNEAVLILLHSVTHPAGLDHDRVILFLADEEGKTLRPAADLEKAEGNGQLKELTRTLLEVRQSRLRAPGLLGPGLAGVQMPLRNGSSVLAQALIERRALRVDQPESDPRVPPELLSALGPGPFAAVPMFAKAKAVGVLVVNNFKSGHPLSDRDLRLLAMLANLGALAVETSRLYQHLEHANRELAQMRNRLLEADKLAALGEVAAGVAHEIRNPLVSIGGFTRRIRKKVGENSPITPYLDVIIEEVTRLERTLNEMLDFSTDARNHFEEHDLNLIMDQALDLLRRELDEGHIQISKEYGSDLPRVFCDDRQIKHVFLNIYLNAIQAMGREGGRLTLRTYAVMREGKQFVAGEVADSGGGIPMEVIHNIFNPFFTTKDSGSGLGLSIVHKIVTRHFGQVEVHNREGQGASFMVTLPAAEEGRAYLK